MGFILFHSPSFSGVTVTNKCSHAQEGILTRKNKKKEMPISVEHTAGNVDRTSGNSFEYRNRDYF